KRILLDNICEGRSLIIMGYSGINDFDIMPTIKVIKNLKELIWINHSESIQPGNEIIYEIISGKSQSLPKINKDLILIAKKLHEISRFSNKNKIYLINANTANIVKELIQVKVKLSSEILSLNIKDWFKENIKSPSVFEKISIASRIYYDFGLFSDAMRCSEIMIRLTTLSDVESWKLMAEEAIYKSFIYQRKSPEPLNQRIKGDKTKNQREILTMRSKCLNLIANIYHSKENYSDAMKKFEEILVIHEKLGNLKDVTTSLNNIANIYYTNNKYNEALKNYNRALKIYNQLGDLNNKINSYINIGECFFAQNDYPKAIKSYLSALKINREQGFLKGKVASLNRLGEIMRIQENYSKALKFTMNAIKVNDQLRDLSGKASSIKLIASIKNDQGYYQEAIKFYNRALKIYEKLGDLSMKGECFINIGEIYRIQGNLSEASKQYKEALNLSKKLEDLKGKAICLNYIGNILRLQGNYPEALELCLSALKINEEGNNLSARANFLKNIALINHDQGNYPEALKFYRESLLIYKNYKLSEKSEINDIKKKIEAIFRLIQKNYIRKKKETIQPDLPEVKLEINEKKDIKFQLNSSDLTKENNDYKDFEINLKFYEEMLKNAELSGDLYKRLKAINQIGEIYRTRGWYIKAVKIYEEGLEIAGKLEDKSIKFTFVSKIRALYNDFFNTF
ncbi:MAG: tetratricopeptide repeat protein, partial [Promethearchaeota archaeon]